MEKTACDKVPEQESQYIFYCVWNIGTKKCGEKYARLISARPHAQCLGFILRVI